jgi:thiol:disulfide interchange protein/DsbC/DsbD-like thiol-disulfide interchange protein
VRLLWKAILTAGLALFAAAAPAAHTRVDLLLSAATARPGDTVMAGVRLKMDPLWHTYWRNSGDSGSPTRIEWQLPAGITAGDVQWPVPEKLTVSGLTDYIYEDEVVLLVPLTLASNAPAGPVELDAKVSWLECAEICVPGKQDIAAKLNIGSEASPSTNAPLIGEWQGKIPTPFTNLVAHAWWESPAKDNTRAVILEWSAFAGGQPATFNVRIVTENADFFPYENVNYEVLGDTTNVSGSPLEVRWRKTVNKFSGDWPKEISGVLAIKDGLWRGGHEARFSIADQAPADKMIRAPANAPGVSAPQSPWLLLLFAFVGGLILNFMPCVLPVIALKILGFVAQASENPRRVRQLGLLYTAGVLASFLALAALVIGVQAAGHKAGWGMQFQSPVFVVLLTALVTLVALNLFGVFEVTLGGGALDAADRLARRQGGAGAFFNGVLATVLATPCTAPFLAPALGFAFAQTAPVIALFFAAAGLGLAAPYLALSCQPRWLKFLPKPGAWMETFKILMGFPMLGTAVWLYDVASAYYGERTWWLGIFLVLLALTAWFYGEFVQRGRFARGLALGTTLVLLLTGYAVVLEGQLHWRSVAQDLGDVPLQEGAQGIEWQAWSPQAVAGARAAGRPVLVDFTAKWCTTCRVNKATAIEIPSVRAKLKALNAVALLGDYTHFPDAITDELRRFNQAGVPLVLVYPADASRPPQVLPALLTPGIVLDALNKAAP